MKSRQMSRALIAASRLKSRRQLRDRNWAYRRSGLFGRDDHQHGGIPVALTLQQLDTQLFSHGMLYTTCLELAPGEAAINACETDFVVVTTGFSHHRPHLPQVIIGECKIRRAGKSRGTMRNICDVSLTRFRETGSIRSSYSQRLATSQLMRSKHAPLRRTDGDHACSSFRRMN